MSSTTGGSSLSAFVTSLIVNGIIFIVFFVLFLIVLSLHVNIADRAQLRKKYTRIYEPRTFLGTVPEQ
jgi:hypothetical protein